MYIIKGKLVTQTLNHRELECRESYHPEYGIAYDLEAVCEIFKKGITINGELIIDDETHAHSKGYNSGAQITWAEYEAVPVNVVYADSADSPCEKEKEAVEFDDSYDEDLFE